ncbi:uncharacterized protein [Halyomorpha halys]|uniref:uncharacterized protein n=1 Tax=Halyomorpha halys TaxID=286706 RepID=UPI0006D50415|nr:uncharacterized protein LOC106678189 [Halyomorpha halys]
MLVNMDYTDCDNIEIDSDLEDHIEDEMEVSAGAERISEDHVTSQPRHYEDSSDSDDEPYVAPAHLVQINATKAEVDQMINSFIAGRRARVNQQNIREFCGPDYDGQSCARVSAVHFTKRLVQVEDAEKYWERFKKK